LLSPGGAPPGCPLVNRRSTTEGARPLRGTYHLASAGVRSLSAPCPLRGAPPIHKRTPQTRRVAGCPIVNPSRDPQSDPGLTLTRPGRPPSAMLGSLRSLSPCLPTLQSLALPPLFSMSKTTSDVSAGRPVEALSGLSKDSKRGLPRSEATSLVPVSPHLRVWLPAWRNRTFSALGHGLAARPRTPSTRWPTAAGPERSDRWPFGPSPR